MEEGDRRADQITAPVETCRSQEALYSSLTSSLSALMHPISLHAESGPPYRMHVRDLFDNSQKKTDSPKSDARDNVIFLKREEFYCFLKAAANEEEGRGRRRGSLMRFCPGTSRET
jgi:hypothetical protein